MINNEKWLKAIKIKRKILRLLRLVIKHQGLGYTISYLETIIEVLKEEYKKQTGLNYNETIPKWNENIL